MTQALTACPPPSSVASPWGAGTTWGAVRAVRTLRIFHQRRALLPLLLRVWAGVWDPEGHFGVPPALPRHLPGLWALTPSTGGPLSSQAFVLPSLQSLVASPACCPFPRWRLGGGTGPFQSRLSKRMGPRFVYRETESIDLAKVSTR